MNINLKSCPFCGSANVHAYTYKDAVYRQYAVKCKKCGARIMAASTELAIKKWNRRTERTAKVDRCTIFPVKVCDICHSVVDYPNKHCSECGAKLDWSDDE